MASDARRKLKDALLDKFLAEHKTALCRDTQKRLFNLGDVPYQVTAFHTDTPRYTAHAQSLVKSALTYGVSVDVQTFPHDAAWAKNTQNKPKHLLAMLVKHKKPIAYLDVDSRLAAKPRLFLKLCGADDADIYVHKFRSSYCTGTLFIRNSLAVRLFLAFWLSVAEREGWMDQDAFNYAVRLWTEIVPGFRIGSLPAEYCAISDSSQEYTSEPVIVHEQESRNKPEAKIDYAGRRLPAGSYVAGSGLICLEKGNAHQAETIAQLDARYPRVGSNRQVWTINRSVLSRSKTLHAGLPAVLVGKGPSLDRATAETFAPFSVAFCINESINTVYPLIEARLSSKTDYIHLALVQQDQRLRGVCHKRNIPHYTNRSSFQVLQDRDKLLDDLFYFEPGLWGESDQLPTAVCALYLLHGFGVRQVSLLGFDGAQGDNFGYASCAIEPPDANGEPERFADIGKRVLATADKLGLKLTFCAT